MDDRETMQEVLDKLEAGVYELAAALLRERLATLDWTQPYDFSAEERLAA
jgi:hypothetical protein